LSPTANRLIGIAFDKRKPSLRFTNALASNRKVIEDAKAIYIHSHNSEIHWVGPRRKAPELLDSPYTLATQELYYNDAGLTRLFTDILAIPDADWEELVLKIEEWQDNKTGNPAVHDSYRQIMQGVNNEDVEELR